MTALENRDHEDFREGAGGRPSRWSDFDGVTVAILIAGLIPIVGYLVLGEWGPGDLAVGTLFVLFGVTQLVRHLLRRR